MSRQTPFVQRRGHALFFRLQVPKSIRQIIGAVEITKALKTSDRDEAAHIALDYASKCKRVFLKLKSGVETVDFDKLKAEMTFQKRLLKRTEEIDRLHDELLDTRLKIAADHKAHKLEAERKEITHQQELRTAVAEATATATESTLKHVLASPLTSSHPLPAHAAPPALMHMLSDILPEWISVAKPATTSIKVFNAAVGRFEKLFPELHIEEITKPVINKYIAKLSDSGLSPSTIDKEHAAMRALLNVAVDHEWIIRNPAVGVRRPKVAKNTVRAFTFDELKTIFKDPLFTKIGLSPRDVKSAAQHGDAPYWLPLLALFTGARREELCQLTTQRVKISEGIHFLEIDTVEEGGKLKTEQSIRTVPIHDQLLKLGFLDFVATRKKAGGGMLFHMLKVDDDGHYGASIGDWWGKYLQRKISIIADKSERKKLAPFHSFRHAFIDESRRLRIRPDYERALVGHVGENTSDSHDGYGGFHLPELAEELNRINFRGLDLSQLWKK